MTHIARLFPLLAFSALSACHDPVTPVEDGEPVAPATVVVGADTVVAVVEPAGSHQYVRMDFPVSVTNTGPDTLRLFDCSTWLEGKRNGNWYYTGGGGCFLHLPQGADIPPGATREFMAKVTAALTGPYAEFKGTFPGEYRYRVGLTWTGLRGRIPNPPSNTFVAVLLD
jgi:hypothetical protein